MSSEKRKDHGEPPKFAQWLIWLFRRETWKEQPVIAVVATVITISAACSGIYGVYKLIAQSGDQVVVTPHPDGDENEPVAEERRKVVVLMDSTLREVVYDPATFAKGGTNADDITEVIDDLPINTIKETTSLAWKRDEEVLNLDPDLIVIHLSAFYDKTNAQDSDRRLETFLRYMASSRAHFIMYTRAPSLESEAAQVQWTRQTESRLPPLRRRIHLFFVPSGPAATFKAPDTARRLKLLVKETLAKSAI